MSRGIFVSLVAFAVSAPHMLAEEVKEVPVSRVVDDSNVEHYVWGGVNDGWRYVNRDDLSVIHERMSPGAKEVRHFHRKARQFFHVLSGTFSMELDGTVYEILPGQGLEIPPGAPHQAMNLSEDDVNFIVVSVPTSSGDRVEVGPAAGD